MTFIALLDYLSDYLSKSVNFSWKQSTYVEKLAMKLIFNPILSEKISLTLQSIPGQIFTYQIPRNVFAIFFAASQIRLRKSWIFNREYLWERLSLKLMSHLKSPLTRRKSHFSICITKRRQMTCIRRSKYIQQGQMGYGVFNFLT